MRAKTVKHNTNSKHIRNCASMALVKGVFSVGYYTYLKTLTNGQLSNEFKRLRELPC